MTEHQRQAVPSPGRPVVYSGVNWVGATAWAVVQRPGLWGVALRSARRSAQRGWWHRWPPLPVPSVAYLRFRVQTHTGTAGPPSPADVLAFLKWSRSFEGVAR